MSRIKILLFFVSYFFSLCLFKRFLKLKLMYTGICDIDDLKDNSNKRPSDLIFIKVPFLVGENNYALAA